MKFKRLSYIHSRKCNCSIPPQILRFPCLNEINNPSVIHHRVCVYGISTTPKAIDPGMITNQIIQDLRIEVVYAAALDLASLS